MKMAVVQSLCVLFFAASLVSCQNSLSLLNGDVAVQWRHLSASQEIEFTVTAKTTGYVALGISKHNNAMQNIDVFFGKVAGGSPSIEDRWVNGKATPSEDTQQDVKLVSGSETGGETTLTFKRKLDTGDMSGKDIKIDVGSSYYLAVALGNSDALTPHAYDKKTYSPSKVVLVQEPATSSTPPSSTTSMATPSPTSAVAITSSPTSSSEMPTPTPTSTVTATSSAMPVNMFSFKDGSVSWTFDHNTNEISFTVKAKATGWVGLGITTQNKAMANMDIAIGGVYTNKTAYIGQFFSSSTRTPQKNANQNVQLISASEKNGETIVTFKRLLNTTDSRDIVIKRDAGYYLAWAYHRTVDGLENLQEHDEKGYSTNMVLVKSTNPTTTPATTPNASRRLSCDVILVAMVIAAALMMT